MKNSLELRGNTYCKVFLWSRLQLHQKKKKKKKKKKKNFKKKKKKKNYFF